MENKFILKPEGQRPSEIMFAEFEEQAKCEMKVCEIRIEARVKIFDVAFENDSNLSRHQSKTPQYLAIEQKITHELLENVDPYIIGELAIKAYKKLKAHISQHVEGI